MAFCVGRLILVFIYYYQKLFAEIYSSTMLDWLERNAGSPIVLLLMNTVINSLKPNQISLGLKVVEKCITLYFKSVFAMLINFIILNRPLQYLISQHSNSKSPLHLIF